MRAKTAYCFDRLSAPGWTSLAALLAGSGCSIGLHAAQARNPDQARSLTPFDDRAPPLTGTVDESMRSTELSFGGLIARRSFVIDLGASFGVRAVGFEAPTDGLATVLPPDEPDGFEGRGIYDAYFVGAMVPLTTVDELVVGAFGRAQITGLSRLVSRSDASYDLEGGLEVNLPTAGKDRVFLRLGVVYEAAGYYLEMADHIGSATGSASFVGLATTVGVRVGP